MKRAHLAQLLLAAASILSPAVGRAADTPTTTDCLKFSDAAATLTGQKRLRPAAQQYLNCANRACPAEIQRECSSRYVELKATIPTILFEVVDADGHRLVDPVSVSMDGEPLPGTLDGTPSLVDPGAHVFKFESSGKVLTTTKLFIVQTDRGRNEKVTIPPADKPTVGADAVPLAASASAPVAPAAPAASAPQVAQPPSPTLEDRSPPASAPSSRSIRSTVGIVALAAGAAFVLVGGVVWKQGDDKYNDISALCSSQNGCTQAERDDAQSAVQSRDRLAVGGFVIGGALLAGGVAALLWPSSGEGASTHVSWGADPIDRAVFVKGAF